MAEKAEESIAKRLSRKRDSFYEQKESEFTTVKKKRKSSLRLDEIDPSCDRKTQHQSDHADIETGCDTSEPGFGSQRCDQSFFCTDCESLAQALLGCILVRRFSTTGGRKCEYRGRIVETEAYLGREDKAAHSFNGRKTERNSAMFMQPGTAYVYSIYGMHCCFNISSNGVGAAVLVRALEPVAGLEGMRQRRKAAKKDKDLCSGPAKLCQAMDIDKSCDKVDLVLSDTLWVEPSGSPVEADDVTKTGRIGVDYAEEWAKKPLRYYIKGNPCVSKK